MNNLNLLQIPGIVRSDLVYPQTLLCTTSSQTNPPLCWKELEDFTYSLGFDANRTPTNFIPSGGQTATSVSTINITSTTRSDSGVYEVVSYNEAGRGAANFTLDVQCEPA